MTRLGACRKFNDVSRGEKVFNILLEVDPTNAPAYVLLSIFTLFVAKWKKQQRSLNVWNKTEPKKYQVRLILLLAMIKIILK